MSLIGDVPTGKTFEHEGFKYKALQGTGSCYEDCPKCAFSSDNDSTENCENFSCTFSANSAQIHQRNCYFVEVNK